MKMSRAVSYWSGVTAALSCSVLSTRQDADRISLENIIEESGINFVFANSDTANRHQIETMTAGVAVFHVSMKTAISRKSRTLTAVSCARATSHRKYVEAR